MARYDWPAAPRRSDSPGRRTLHLQRYRPRADASSLLAAIDLDVDDDNLWFPIGPSVTTGGQATGRPNVSGRFRDLHVEPNDGNRVYAASAGGGVWYSPDGGDSWRPLDDWQQTTDRRSVGELAAALSCGALHVKWGTPADGHEDVVWVGTGELDLARGRPSEESVLTSVPGSYLKGIGFLTATGPATGGGWTPVTVAEAPPAGTGWTDSLIGHATYRIVADPDNDDHLVAATTNGLYLKPPVGDWHRVPGWLAPPSVIPAPPAGTTRPDNPQPLDVVLTRPAVDRLRIWVASTSELWFAEFNGVLVDATALPTIAFHRVQLDGVLGDFTGGTRLAIAATHDGSKLYVLGRSPGATSRDVPVAALWAVNATSNSPTATPVTGIPAGLFGPDGNDQSDYDMCIAVHPDNQFQAYIGGSYVHAGQTYDAGVYRCTVAGAIGVAIPIGQGVHADDHVIRFGPVAPGGGAKRIVWIGCDGGLYRSDSDGDQGTFFSRNNGLAVLQPGYVASHPTNPGVVVAGFQDNGTQLRVGDTVWTEAAQGDGGGVLWDPTPKNRYFYQYIKSDWSTSDGGQAPVLRHLTKTESERTEDDAATFYSGADTVIHGGLTHLAFGTDRVWYSTDWGHNWVTIPSRSDPRKDDNANTGQDVLHPKKVTNGASSLNCCAHQDYTGPGTIAVKFSPRTNKSTGNLELRLLALFGDSLVWLEGSRTPDGTAPFDWLRIPKVGTLPTQHFRASQGDDENQAFRSGAPLTFMPGRGRVSDLAVHDPAQFAFGTCYVTTLGDEALSGALDTMYFFDGDNHWIPCGLRQETPQGTWDPPESRVGAPALGVVVDPAHPGVVYVATSVGVVRGTLVITTDPPSGAMTYHWTWSPFVNNLPEAAVQDLSIRSYGEHGEVRLLRAALQSRGVWETDLANVTSSALTYVRVYPSDTRRLLPTPLSGPVVQAEDRVVNGTIGWDDSPDIVIDETGGALPALPGEAELFSLNQNRVAAANARVDLSTTNPRVHVLVHHRWREPAPAADVRVALLIHPSTGPGVDVPLDGLWPTLVAAAKPAAPPPVLPGLWQPALAGSLILPLVADVDARTPRSTHADLSLTGTSPGDAFVLLAVVMSGTNLITEAEATIAATGQPASTVAELVVISPHAAAKSIAVPSPPGLD